MGIALMEPGDGELLSRVPASLRAANGIPQPEQTAARERAAALASDALADLLLPGGVRTSPLGPGWSNDVDLHLTAWPDQPRLEALGWIPLDRLLQRLGTPNTGSWAVVEDNQVLACLDLHLGPPPDPVTSLLGRCRRRGEVRVREVLEARALLRAGHTLPTDDPVIRLAARVEAGLGGQALAAWKDGPAVGAPSPLPVRRGRWPWSKVRSALRPRLSVAISGVDGSGKSTLIRLVGRNLDRAGVPNCRIWARPGGGKMNRWLDSLGRLGKRLLGEEPSSWGSAQVTKGVPASDLPRRRGVVGWTWAMLVTLRFLLDVRRQHFRGRGVLLHDRHLLDALVHLDFVYGGVDLRPHRALIRWGVPAPRLSLYLDVPADVALARKPEPEEPEDIFIGRYTIRSQLEGYETYRGEVPQLVQMNGQRPPDELAAVVTRRLADA